MCQYPYISGRVRVSGCAARCAEGLALPTERSFSSGYAPSSGAEPQHDQALDPVGRSHHRTSGGTAANPDPPADAAGTDKKGNDDHYD
jgi:hypothetical protein